MYKVSVALTTYNGEKYIKEQLSSILFQRYPADEVIIIDDASTDNTVNIIKDFIEKNQLTNWHFFINPKNVGFIKNFHNAIRMSTGNIIFLCDQDDVWYKTKIGTMVNCFKSNRNIKALCSSFKIIDKRGNHLSTKTLLNHSNNNLIKFRVEPFSTVKIDLSTICSYNISPGCTLAFNKEVKDIFLDKTSNSCIHDWEICLIASFLDGLYFLNTPLMDYRIHDKNTIGLSEITSISNKAKLSKHEVRIEKAKNKFNYLSSMKAYSYLLNNEQYKIFNSSVEFAKSRLNALDNKNIKSILKLYKNRDQYVRSVTFKGRLADIICVIKK